MSRTPQDTPDLLVEKCLRLQRVCQVQSSQIRALESVQKEAERKRTTYEDVTLLVKRFWDTLCDDVSLLYKHARRGLDGCTAAPALATEVNGITCSDPFLAALVGCKQEVAERVFKAELQLRDDYGAIEKALQAKADDTARLFKSLLTCIQGLREANKGAEKGEPAAELAENGHVSPSRDAGEEPFTANAGMNDGGVAGGGVTAFKSATVAGMLTRLCQLQGLHEAISGTAKAEPAAELAENGHASRSGDAIAGDGAAEAAAGVDGGGAASSGAAGNSSSSKRIKLEDGTAAAAGEGGGELTLEQELLVCQGQCRSLASTSRHLAGQLEAERLRVCDVSNRLAEREAEVERLLLRLKEVFGSYLAGHSEAEQLRVCDVSQRLGERKAEAGEQAVNATQPVAASAAAEVKPARGAAGSAAAVADAAQGPSVDELLTMKVEQLQQRLDAAEVQLREEKSTLACTQMELRAMEEDLKNEASWVPKTNLFQAKVAEIEQLRGECRDALLVQAQLRSDKEAAAREIAQLQGEYENLRLMLSHHEEAKAKLDEVVTQQQVQLEECSKQLQQAKQAAGDGCTVAELQKFVATASAERDSLKQSLLAQAKASTAGKAPSENVKALSDKVDELNAELRSAKEQLSSAAAEAAGMRSAADAALARQAELHSMLAVLSAFTDDDREVAECRASEKRLEAALVDARAALEEAGVSTSEPRMAAVRAALWEKRLLEAQREVDAAAVRLAAAERIAEEAEAGRREAEGVFAETSKDLDVTGEACDRAQRQNADLLKLLVQRDEAAAAAAAAYDTAQRAIAARDEEIKRLHMSLAEAKAVGTIAGQRSRQLVELNGVIKALEATKATAVGEAAVAQKMTTELKRALQDRDAQLSELERQLKERRVREAELAGSLAAEEQQRRKAEAAAQDAEARLQRARETGLKSEQLDELNEECSAMKRILCCSVCNKKPKQVVLSKCWHLFCHDCIKTRLGQRSRKCPTCGIAFGAADVHEVFM